MSDIAVLVTCINRKNIDDVTPHIEKIFAEEDIQDAMDLVRKFKKLNCSNTSLYKIMIKGFAKEQDVSNETATEYLDTNYKMTPTIVQMPE